MFVDYDGVLHRGDAYRTHKGIVSSDPGHIQLFEYAAVLNGLLEPYPSVEVVLSSSSPRIASLHKPVSSRDIGPLIGSPVLTATPLGLPPTTTRLMSARARWSKCGCRRSAKNL
ncbi:hypothetical protein [Ralstonia sp. GX3-BWBA]|uniref:hypothetical protein n=1 Tax=Ralstonia sp. GX3-BWBA TaxID=2219865 RepID=UPI0031BB9DA9